MKKVELKALVGGALEEQFEKAFETVIENLQNPNTSFKTSREITIKLKFTQNEKRDDVRCAVQVSEKLAPQAPMETSFAVGKDLKTGKLYAEEYGNFDQIHMDIDNDFADEIDVDTETGEVIEPNNKIIDLRRARA